ncbi:erythromycin esterase family protein [Streptomyces sp. BH055]|uniref:erythromycin esterase family protein n=1 Tax=Streptomyces sp. BH055 TaxID=3401173 RepID=UPI003BB78B5F
MFPSSPRLLALGEPVHGEATLLELRNTLFQQLVEQEDYRTIALETDCLRASLVDDYVTGGEGTLEQVMESGFSHQWFNLSEGNRALVRWMRAYNEDRPASQQVRFAGFEAPLEEYGAASPRLALIGLHSYLAARVPAERLPCTEATLDTLLGADDRWTERGAMMDPTQSVGQSREAEQLRRFAQELVDVVEKLAPRPAAAVAIGDREEWDRACRYGRTAVGLLRYHYWMADSSPQRVGRLLGQREVMMAENLLALADRGPLLASGHNGHLQRNNSSMRMGEELVEWPSGGVAISERLGARYAVLTTLLGTLHHRGVGAPAPDTIEGVLHSVADGPTLVDASQLAAAVGRMGLIHRESEWYGYSPTNPDNLDSSDVIVFVRDVVAA